MNRKRPLALACTLGLLGFLTNRPTAFAAEGQTAQPGPSGKQSPASRVPGGDRKPTVRIIGNGVEMDLPLDWDESFSIQVPTSQLEDLAPSEAPVPRPAASTPPETTRPIQAVSEATPSAPTEVADEMLLTPPPAASPSPDPTPAPAATPSPTPTAAPSPEPSPSLSPPAAATASPEPVAGLPASATPSASPASESPVPSVVASESVPVARESVAPVDGPGLPSPEPAPELMERVPSPAPRITPVPRPRPTPVALDPVETLRKKARVLAADGRFREALDLLDEALQELDDDPRLHAQRGSVLYVMGDVAGARKAWLRALARDPGNPEVREFLDWLDRRDRSSFKRR